MTLVKAGTVYFLLVFAAGLVLSVFRELRLSPWLGAKAAELAEMPVMWLVIALAARWTGRRFPLSATPPTRLWRTDGCCSQRLGWYSVCEG
ncbi:hypothetical protein [Guyparkeria sp.]|uniref:hypothetical protein n=1 Tax=Guyparkeria sp. TaxID=2035736 RepID=UPI0039710973